MTIRGSRPPIRTAGAQLAFFGQEVKDQGQILAHHAADGAQNRQGQGAHHQEGEHGDKDQVDRLGNDPVEGLFHIGLHKHHQNDGDDGASVAHQVEGNQVKEPHRLPCRHHGAPVGVHHDAGHRSGQNRVALELLGLGKGQQNGQEVKDRVGKEIEDGVGLAGGIHQLKDHQEGQQGFQHAGAGQGRDDGLEHARHKVDHPLKGALFLGGGPVCLGRGLIGQQWLDGVEHFGHVGADDHLIDTAVQNHLFDGVQFF